MVNTDFYSNAKIYKIVDNTNGNIYVGSTCKKLCQRIAQHRSSYKCYLNGNPNYISSFKILENGDYDIILLENCENITNKEQLRARERYYIESLDCVNIRVEGRTKKEWLDDNKDYHKDYQKDNKEKIKEHKKQYYLDNKNEILEQVKQYRIDNKNKIKELKKEYRKNNLEKIKEHKSKICLCVCGCNYTQCHKARHEKTNIHQKYIKTLLK